MFAASRAMTGASILALAVIFSAPVAHSEPPAPNVLPTSDQFTSAPLQNSMNVLLNAEPTMVWHLVGDLSRLHEYNSGIKSSDIIRDSEGDTAAYICRFHPLTEDSVGASHTEIVRWYLPNVGYASTAVEPNLSGMRNSLVLVTIHPHREGTRMEYEMFYDSDTLDRTSAELNLALADMSSHLIEEFGGEVLELYAASNSR